MPWWMAMTSVFAIVAAGQQLSSASGGREIFGSLFVALIVGLGGGGTLSFISSFDKEDAKPLQGKQLHAFAGIMIVGAVAIALILLLPQRDIDNGKLEPIAEFGTPDASLVLAVTQAPVMHTKMGMLTIQQGEASNLMVVDRDDWPSLTDLWSKTKSSMTGQWHTVGEIREHGMPDTTHLTVSAGPGVRFSFWSEHGASVTFEMPASDVPRFDASLRQVGASFSD
jgi:hypothetical protein